MNGDDRPEGRDPQAERLSARLDGELDKDGADSMSALISTDAALGKQAERMKRIDALVRAAVPEEAVPAALLQRLGLDRVPADSHAAAPAGEVVDLAAARRERTVAAAATSATAPQGRWSGRALWRIAAQVLVIGGVGLGAALWLAPHDRTAAPDAAYRTLSNAPRTATSVRPAINALVVFDAGTDAAAAHRIAAQAGARLVGTPTASGAWKASIAPGQRDAVLAALRQDHAVTMAEPIDGVAP